MLVRSNSEYACSFYKFRNILGKHSDCLYPSRTEEAMEYREASRLFSRERFREKGLVMVAFLVRVNP